MLQRRPRCCRLVSREKHTVCLSCCKTGFKQCTGRLPYPRRRIHPPPVSGQLWTCLTNRLAAAVTTSTSKKTKTTKKKPGRVVKSGQEGGPNKGCSAGPQREGAPHTPKVTVCNMVAQEEETRLI